MKSYFLYVGALGLLGLVALGMKIPELANASSPIARDGEVARELEDLRPANREHQLVAEINWARTDPAAYADWLETLRPYYDGMILSVPGEDRILTYEGRAALEETIALLRVQPPLPPLRLSVGMSRGAGDWVIHPTSSAGNVGDRLSRYGSWSGSALETVSSSQQSAAATVAAWLINDGQPARPMQATLLNDQLEFVGVACGDRLSGNRPNGEFLCVLNYATDYTEQDGGTASLADTPIARLSLIPEDVPTAILLPSDRVAAADLDSNVVPAPSVPNRRSPEPLPSAFSRNPVTAAIANPDLPAPIQPSPGVPMPMLMAAIAQTDYVSNLAAAEFLDDQELELVAEANRLRDNPAAYADELENLVQYFDGNLLRLPGLPPLETIEGATAVKEAIAALRQRDRLPLLPLSNGLSLAARDHARDLGSSGRGGHIGRDRSTPFERMNRYGLWDATPRATAGENIGFSPWVSAYWHILQWVIDDGVSNRGHREALLRPYFQFTGVACHSHAYGNVCVMTYASDYSEGN